MEGDKEKTVIIEGHLKDGNSACLSEIT